MYCPKCGKELKEGVKFCTGCGEKLISHPASEKTGMQQMQKTAPQKKENTVLWVGLTAFCFAAAVSIAAGSSIYTQRKGPVKAVVLDLPEQTK